MHHKWYNTYSFMKKNLNKLKSKFNVLKKNIKKKTTSFYKVVKKQNPFVSLFIVLSLLLLTIAVSNFIKKPKIVEEIIAEIKAVATYSVGEAPRIEISAQVQQSQVITIVSLSGGVIRDLPVKVGEKVYRGQNVASLSTDYYGNNAAYVQKEIAQAQYDNVTETYDTQKELINKQKDLAEKQSENAEELRKIADASIGETQDLLELNESMLAGVDLAIENATTSAEISQLNAQKSQLLAGINQIKSGLRQAQYQGDDDKPPSELAQMSKEMTLEQIKIQEKALEMSKAISELQLKLAKIQAATMYPGTPVAGVVERIHVQENQMVSPGTPIATIRANTGATQLIARVSKNTAEKVSRVEATQVIINNQVVELYPDHVSTVATDGSLYSITYTLPEEYSNSFSNKGQVILSIPLGSADTTTVVPYLPLESVHQSELESTVFILDGETVISKTVTLGSIDGRFVAIESGLEAGDQIILDRDVVEGQSVTSK
jgi:multidrug efflux pump subunit AcrA (membrane-fusion protein)